MVPLLIAIAYFTLAERKIIAAVQRRKGPNMFGFWGLLQPVADGLKLLTQEQFFPKNARKVFFLMAPCLVFFFSLLYWLVIPTAFGAILSTDLSLLVVHTISSISVFGVFLAGMSSNSKYAVIGSIRAVSQFISYEICSGLCFLFIALMSGSLSLSQIVWTQQFCGPFCFVGWPFLVGYFICVLAETNRTPFDLSEAEAELVAGFHTEYSSTGFALFFLGEYCNILVFSTIIVLLFFGGWNFFIFPFFNLTAVNIPYWCKFSLNFCLFIKSVSICVIIILIRAYEPRLRYDQVMALCWKNMLPVLFGIFFLFAEAFFFINTWKYVFVFVSVYLMWLIEMELRLYLEDIEDEKV